MNVRILNNVMESFFVEWKYLLKYHEQNCVKFIVVVSNLINVMFYSTIKYMVFINYIFEAIILVRRHIIIKYVEYIKTGPHNQRVKYYILDTL